MHNYKYLNAELIQRKQIVTALSHWRPSWQTASYAPCCFIADARVNVPKAEHFLSPGLPAFGPDNGVGLTNCPFLHCMKFTNVKQQDPAQVRKWAVRSGRKMFPIEVVPTVAFLSLWNQNVLRRRSYFETGTKMVDHCDNCGCEALIIFSALPSRPPSLVRPGDWFFVRQNMFAYGYYWTVYGARINASKCLHRPPVAPKGSKWGQLGGTGFTVKSSDCVGLISCILFSV